jgi:endoglucanase
MHGMRTSSWTITICFLVGCSSSSSHNSSHNSSGGPDGGTSTGGASGGGTSSGSTSSGGTSTGGASSATTSTGGGIVGDAGMSPLQDANVTDANSITYDKHITVDQFGYRPNDSKVAVIRNPQTGYDATDNFTPGTHYQLRQASDGTVVFSGAPTQWNNGMTDDNSGDQGWWFDFSSVTTTGVYFVFDVDKNVRSPVFAIAQSVYADALKAAVRMYYYQRSGTPKLAANAGTGWADSASFLGANQSSQAHDITDPTNAAKVRDVSGGWYDAGDTNHYVTFTRDAVHRLLAAYEQNPSAFGDDYNIPESGNGVPDIIDEVKWEMDYLVKMQNADGTAALKSGVEGYPTISGTAGVSSITDPIFYIPTCTSATISVAGLYAHGAIVMQKFSSLTSYAADLQQRAVKAWGQIPMTSATQINMGALETNCDTGMIAAGNADDTAARQSESATVAAIYLFALTGDAKYSNYVVANYKALWPYNNGEPAWSVYVPSEGEAELYYAGLPNADATTKAAILADKTNNAKNNSGYGYSDNASLYRSFFDQYYWGSNQFRADYGTTNLDMVAYNLDSANKANYEKRAVEMLHYFHGVNPFGMVYLSNMYSYGITASVNEIFHTWFWEGTKWSDAKTSPIGPAPGYMPGGPQCGWGPVAGQPNDKCYQDTNSNSAQSYQVSEPGIYYQAAYVKLLSAFVP